MKLICEEDRRAELMASLQEYAHLSITLVQKGCDYDDVCIQFDPANMEALFAILTQFSYHETEVILAYQQEEMHLIDPLHIVYIEGYRKEAFLHTLHTSYRIQYRLYELEEQLTPLGFLRINKSMIVNIRMIHRIIPAINACYTMELKNGISLECSRQYWKLCKQKLKMR